jgi:general secretion pathway protein H
MGREVTPSSGFTLIELLIVVIIIASAAAIVSVAIGGDAYEDEARKEAEEFLLRGDYLAEQAIFRGETYGAFFYPADNKGNLVWCYQWQRVRDSRWQPIEELGERCLPQDYEVEILIDNQAWQYDDSLEYHDPVMGFYPSGEGSAMVNLRFFRESSSRAQAKEEEFLLTPAGELRWISEEERLEAGS